MTPCLDQSIVGVYHNPIIFTSKLVCVHVWESNRGTTFRTQLHHVKRMQGQTSN